MARSPSFRRLTLSVLDRLVEEGTREVLSKKGLRGGAAGDHAEHFAAVERDLENLLNTRRSPIPQPEGMAELRKSVVTYGIPDLAGVDLASGKAREEFRKTVEDAIRAFEPRFKTVNVKLRDQTGSARILNLRIEGTLHAEPVPEPVVFDSMVEPVACQIDVKVKRE